MGKYSTSEFRENLKRLNNEINTLKAKIHGIDEEIKHLHENIEKLKKDLKFYVNANKMKYSDLLQQLEDLRDNLENKLYENIKYTRVCLEKHGRETIIYVILIIMGYILAIMGWFLR